MASQSAPTGSEWLRRNKRGWNPRVYDAWFTHNLFQAAIRAKEQEAFFSALLRSARSDHDVLELGPGTGLYTIGLAGACRRVVAVDSSAAMLDHLRVRAQDAGISNITLVEACAAALPQEGEQFDGLFAAGVFNYLPDLDAVLQRVAGRLRPGGWAVFSVPLTSFGGMIYRATERLSGRRIWTYTPAETEILAGRAGLDVERMTRAGVSRAGMTLVVEARRQAR